MKFAENYEAWAKNKSPVFSFVLFIFPHVFVTLFLYLYFRVHLIPFIIVGIILPDYALYEFYFLKWLGIKENIKDELVRKTINHYVIFVLSVFLLFIGFIELSIVGFSHLLVDYLGF